MTSSSLSKDISVAGLIERGFSSQAGTADLLLIFPPTSVASRYGKENLGKLGGDLIPLGIASIAAFLRDKGYGVGVLDCCALGLTYDEIISVIEEKRPRIIGLSCTTYALPSALELATKIRDHFPDQLIILGGAWWCMVGMVRIVRFIKHFSNRVRFNF